MLEVRNKTPFEVGIVPYLDVKGVEHAVIVIKATFAIGGAPPTVADEQVPLSFGDTFYGEPATSSIRYGSDDGPTKPGTDVVLIGNAHARQAVTSMDVGLAVGPLRKTARVTGDRVWYRSVGSWAMSDPLAFTSMPLVWDRAFGGVDDSSDKPEEHAIEERNPVGTGLVVNRSAERVEGLRLPNIEDPRQLMASPTDRPAPVGFGYVGRHWLPRRSYAGSYDDAWKESRCPLLPLDFDERHFHAAPADLISPQHFVGGEPVQVSGAWAAGDLRFDLPKRSFTVTTMIKAVRSHATAVLDTVAIEPDQSRLVLTYRATVPCPKSFMFIDYIRVAEEQPS